MPEMKFTTGPWRPNLHHTQEQAGRTYGFIHAGTAVPIAAVTLGVEGMPQDEGRANARLIAATPELYNALKAITDCYGVGYKSADKFVEDVHDFMIEGRAALA